VRDRWEPDMTTMRPSQPDKSTATSATARPPSRGATGITGLAAGCLLAAPLVALVARVLMTPWYQDESNHLDSDRYLTAVAEAATRNDVGAGLTFLSGILFAGVALVLARVVRERMPRLALIGGCLGVVGAFGLASVGVASMTYNQIARADERDTMISLMTRLYDADQAGVFFLAMVLGAIGAVLLAIGLYRDPTVSRVAAVLSGLGIAAVFISASGPVRSVIIGSALIATLGLGWIAMSLWSRRFAVATAGIGAAVALASGLVLSPNSPAEDGRALASTVESDAQSAAPIPDTHDRYRSLVVRWGADCIITGGGRMWVSQALHCHE
jgi:hypothetical protein